MFDSIRRLVGGAKKFLPHEFSSRVELVAGLPRILVSREAYEDMFVLVDECPEEVGWLGTVSRVGNDFLIGEVFLFDQEVHGTTCELTPGGLAEFVGELLSSRPDGMEVANSIRFWGHSHHTMGTSPSGQDESQLRELAASCGDFFVRGILNKAGRIEFTIVLASIGVVIRDAGWELWEPQADEARRARWQQEIAAKVREKVAPVIFDGAGVPGFPRHFEPEPRTWSLGRKGKGGRNGR